MKNVKEYIYDNWDRFIHDPDEPSRGIAKLPKPYSIPCANEKDPFTDFYYWDTYFTNLGLMLDGRVEQVENNLENIAFFIRHLGYMPNASHLLDRSQPPLFTRGVWDLYEYTGDVNIIKKYMEEIMMEYNFFRLDRNTPVGLNRFGCNTTNMKMEEAYFWLPPRVDEYMDSYEEQMDLAENLMCIAESGWDFNPRFATDEKKFATKEFAHLDLNCILYDVECKIAKMNAVLGNEEAEKEFLDRAIERKEKMEKYMLNKDNGIFMDYNYEKDCFSKVVSCASMYPFAVGLSDDKEAAKKVLERLELEFGIAACEYRGEDAKYYQWDYPSMWPSNVYFTCYGLKKIGMEEEAKRIAEKYIKTVDKCYEETGMLWEKYDATEGSVSVTSEYETPEMLGWTAGVYRYIQENIL